MLLSEVLALFKGLFLDQEKKNLFSVRNMEYGRKHLFAVKEA